MKVTSKLSYLTTAAVALALFVGVSAYAESPREELVHASRLLQKADHDYAGHRVEAIKALDRAGHELGVEMHGEAPERERQWKSDDQLKEARRLIRDARERMERHDRERVAEHLTKATDEIDLALRVR